jgi:hypothetical protein
VGTFQTNFAKETFPDGAKRYLKTIQAPLLNPLLFRSILEGNIDGPFTTREISSADRKLKRENQK